MIGSVAQAAHLIRGIRRPRNFDFETFGGEKTFEATHDRRRIFSENVQLDCVQFLLLGLRDRRQNDE